MSNARVVIIGGGLVGCLSALRLRDAGADVTVLEKSVPGAEASSAAAGILAAQSESRTPGLLFDLALESRALYVALADELRDRVGADIGYRRSGVIEVCRDDAALEAHEATFAWQRARGLPVERLDARALAAWEPGLGPGLAGAVAFPEDAQLEPPKLVAAVAQAAERAGVRFQSGALVRRVRVQDGRALGVDLDEGFVPADHVVVAAGAWSALVEGAQLPHGAVKPARGQVVELLLRTPPARAVIYGEQGYVVPRADGRVVCGSTLEFVGFRQEVTAGGVAKILNMALRLLPALADATVTRSWSGFRPYTPDGAPLVGSPGIEALTIATGHHRSGILMAPITAELVRERITTGTTRHDLGALAPARATLSTPTATS